MIFPKTAILPVSFVQPAARAARIWCLVRSLDHPDNGGTGCGIVRITLEKLAEWLCRSTRTVWRYIQEAKSKGYFRRCKSAGDEFLIEYTGLKPLGKLLGLERLGAIGEFPLHEIEFAKARAAEIQAEDLQRQSFNLMREEFGKFAKGAATAFQILSKSASSARVPGDVFIARGKRLVYLAPHWRPFGASLRGIAKRLGVSIRTAQYRLSDGWRTARGLLPVPKAQSAHQILEECPKAFLQDFYRLEENSDQKYVFMGKRLFKVGCNLYNPDVALRSSRFRKAEYKGLERTTKLLSAGGVLQGGYTVDLEEIQPNEKSLVFC